MGAEFVVMDPENQLCLAVLERIMLKGHVCFIPDATWKRFESAYAAEISAFPNALKPLSKGPVEPLWIATPSAPAPKHVPFHRCVVLQFAENDTLEVGETHTITVHDMLPSPRGSIHHTMFQSWLNHATNDTAPELTAQGHHWCSIIDASAGIVSTLPHLGEEIASLHLAGRRCWKVEETWNEFQLLAQRTQAGTTGAFELHHLTPDGGPELSVEHLGSGPELFIQRPDIGSFHRFLEQHTGTGWRPTIPLRQSLMMMLAELEQTHAS
jgi:hypothetical protein